jgi:hypothetical protein
MSAVMRFRLLSSVALILGSIVTYACSSSSEESTPPAEENALPAPDRGADPPPASSSPSNGADPGPPDEGSSGGASSGGTSSSGGSSGGGKPDAGASSSSGGSSGAAPSTKCAAGSVAEKEGNNDEASATAMPGATGSACGSLTKADDVDFFSFTMPADKNYLGFGSAFTQQGIEFEITVEGKTFKVGDTPEVKPGQKYVVKVHTTGKAPVDYRLDVEIKNQ